jgi:23S rRNA (cytosine1962-C5)-methyltransferase
MSTNGSRPIVVLRQGREVSIRRRHPWVFSGAVLERKGMVERGSLVDVVSKDGTFLGCGHWGTRGIAVRMLSFEQVESEEKLFSERIDQAVALRKELGLTQDPQTTGFRLIHAEGDGLPGLVIDRYGETAVVQCHSSGMWRLRDSIGSLLKAHPDLHISYVEFRRVDAQVEDQDEGGKDGSASHAAEPHVVTFMEGGLRFLVDVSGGQKTGFFLDQRINRAKVRGYAAGKRVLNAFSYTGAFSVYAFAGGAESVSSVDASKPAVDLARQNVVANFAGVSHHPEVADCFSYLAEIPDTFDMIILDPPAFAKHQRAVQRAVRGYETINALALKKIKPGGILFTFSCSQLVSRDLFRDTVSRAAASAGRNVRIIESLHQAPCHPISVFHPEGDYLKGFVVYVE